MRQVLILSSQLLLVLSIYSCQKDAKGRVDNDENKEDKPFVEVSKVVKGDMERTLKYSSAVSFEKGAQVLARASGEVVKLYVEEGDKVQKGEIMARLDDDAEQAALEDAELELEKQKKEFDITKRLFEAGLVSEKEYNDANYLLDKAHVRVKRARESLENRLIVAPISGVVAEREVRLGDTVSMGQKLFSVIDYNSLILPLSVPEKEIKFLKEGQIVMLQSPNYESLKLRGEVYKIAPIVDRSTGTVEVKVKIPPDDRIRPGMFMEAEVIVEQIKDGLLVPKKAFSSVGDIKQSLFVVRKGIVKEIPVQIVIQGEQFVLVEGDLNEGDLVVISGAGAIRDGIEVEYTEVSLDETD